MAPRGSSRVTSCSNSQLMEDSMKKQCWLLNSGTLFAGLLMLLLLGACAEVKVTCPPAGVGAGDGDDDTGGCTTPFVPWQNGSATGFWNTVTKVKNPATPPLSCSTAGSTKCQTSPGTCGFNKPCKSWYNPTTSYCYCGCP
jgi:hypothetical protein